VEIRVLCKHDRKNEDGHEQGDQGVRHDIELQLEVETGRHDGGGIEVVECGVDGVFVR
jgi:hypothetical protein